MIKIDKAHFAICEKCQTQFPTAQAVVVSELNHVNAMLHEIELCHVAVHKIPGFKSNDWADRMSLWHEGCFPGLVKEKVVVPTTVEEIKALFTDKLKRQDLQDLYYYLHYQMKCRI